MTTPDDDPRQPAWEGLDVDPDPTTRIGRQTVRFEPASPDGPTGGGGRLVERAMASLRSTPPARLGGLDVMGVEELPSGADGPAPNAPLVLTLDGARVVIQPQPADSLLTMQAEVVQLPGDDPATDQSRARAILGSVLADVVATTSSPERIGAPTGGPVTDDRELTARAEAAMAVVGTPRERAADLRRIVGLIDLTTLEGDDTPGRIRALCAAARRPDPFDATVGPVAAVCVYPSLVGLAAELLAGSGVRAASVAGAFPSAQSPLDVRLHDIRSAVAAGAEEIDVVLNRSAFLDQRFEVVAEELAAFRAEAGTAHLKVILEVGELRSAANIGRATDLAIEAGADTVKTSTGKMGTGASPEAVLVMADRLDRHWRATGRRVGLKVAGGVRTPEAALGYLALVRSVLGEAWLEPDLFRFGASGLLAAVVEELAAVESATGPGALDRS
ncbi:MAG: deoxyribose-phosphate aldolase [Actinomycetota bacterium]